MENLSFGKETWQSSTFSDGTSDKAVDGHFESLKWDGKQCSLTIPSTKATWRVNLGRAYAIDHVVFMFRTDNLPWGSQICFHTFFPFAPFYFLTNIKLINQKQIL